MNRNDVLGSLSPQPGCSDSTEWLLRSCSRLCKPRQDEWDEVGLLWLLLCVDVVIVVPSSFLLFTGMVEIYFAVRLQTREFIWWCSCWPFAKNWCSSKTRKPVIRIPVYQQSQYCRALLRFVKAVLMFISQTVFVVQVKSHIEVALPFH